MIHVMDLVVGDQMNCGEDLKIEKKNAAGIFVGVMQFRKTNIEPTSQCCNLDQCYA